MKLSKQQNFIITIFMYFLKGINLWSLVSFGHATFLEFYCSACILTFLIAVCRFYSGMCLLAILLLTTVVKMYLGFF